MGTNIQKLISPLTLTSLITNTVQVGGIYFAVVPEDTTNPSALWSTDGLPRPVILMAKLDASRVKVMPGTTNTTASTGIVLGKALTGLPYDTSFHVKETRTIDAIQLREPWTGFRVLQQAEIDMLLKGLLT